MRFLLAAFSLASAFSACQSNQQPATTDDTKKDSMAATTPIPPANNTLTAAEQADGWQLLFDGSTTKGWHVFKQQSDGAAWKAVDGTLHLDPAQKKDGKTVGGGDMVSDEEYSNFHLKVDWKVDSAGNSGIMFYVKEDPKIEKSYHTGPEMQVLDNAAHPDAKIIKHRAGDLYDLITSSPETVKPAGEWNQAEIIAKDSTLEFFLNGSKVVSTKMWDDNWRKMIAGSKFKDMPLFGTLTSGRLCLQDHGDPVWYRNIRIKKL
ncbi:3-keto-disaccharide hydrolase [Paraflavitalea pollutisoli]|uniref:3-keto-disaccharide hydrolase n=1 Tax=Paraflavitalea pollutisoli TaxID=3034143 RepID=UPI0023EBB168|nr:DUF1080 domain-containing protein [Paraflavitalea sp. H1-2-19X]